MPAYAVVVGNPAQIVHYRFQPETIDRLLNLGWWDWEEDQIAANLDLLYTNPDEWLNNPQIKKPQGERLNFVGMPEAK